MKHYLKFGFGVIAGCLLAAGMAAGIFTATAQTTNLTPVATVTGSITSTAALQVIGSNPGRKSIQVCNVGTAVMWIWPGALSPATSAYELPALSSGTTTCLTPPAGANGPSGSTVGNSWNAQSAGASGVISILEW
jgi:hypothetical protein